MPSPNLPLTKVVLAQFLTTYANQLVSVALPIIVLLITNDPSKAGVMGFVTGVAAILGSVFAGGIIDSLGPRKVSVYSNVLSLVSVLFIPLLEGWGLLNFSSLLIVAFGGAVFDTPGSTAKETMLPRAQKLSTLSLTRVTAYQESIQGLAYTFGPLTAGIILSAYGAVNSLLPAGIAFLVAIITVLSLEENSFGPSQQLSRTSPKINYLTSFFEGLGFLKEDRLLWVTTILGTAYVALYLPLLSVVLPTYFLLGSASQYLGYYLSLQGIGGILGSFLYGKYGEQLNQRNILLLSSWLSLLGSLPLVFLPPDSTLLLFSAVILGFVLAPTMPIVNIPYYTRPSEEKQGRVLAASTALVLSAGPLASLAFGYLVENQSALTGLWVYLGLTFIVTLWSQFNPTLYELDNPTV